jgi:hypothetical protein
VWDVQPQQQRLSNKALKQQAVARAESSKSFYSNKERVPRSMLYSTSTHSDYFQFFCYFYYMLLYVFVII